MADKLQPILAQCQQLICATTSRTMQPMVAGQAKEAAFAARLGAALTASGIPDDRARLRRMARLFGVSREAARKWLSGESRPRTERIESIAQILNVSGEWLLTGRGMMRPGTGVEPVALAADGEPGFMIEEQRNGYNVEVKNTQALIALSPEALTAAQQLDTLPEDMAKQLRALIESCARHSLK